MKKLLSLLTLLSVISVGAYAQGVSGGLKLGLNLSNQTMSSTESSFTSSPSFRPSIHVGGYLTLMLSEKFGVQPEILYSGQGYKETNGTIAIDYITVPVLARYNFTSLFSVHLGPQIGVLMSAKAKPENGGDSQDLKEYLKGTDIGVAAGLGIDLPMGLNFGFRFVKGFTNIIEDSDDVKYKNYNLQLSVGYKLFGKK
jgi:hypothetical protein